jgi:hypothetical protein
MLISESPIYLLFVAAIMGANTVACGYVMPWFVLDLYLLNLKRNY